MQKGLTIVAAFCLVTVGLILLQPKRSPDPALDLPTLRVAAPLPSTEPRLGVVDAVDVAAPIEAAEAAPENPEQLAVSEQPSPEVETASATPLEPELAPLVTALRPVLRPDGLVAEEAPVAEGTLVAEGTPVAERRLAEPVFLGFGPLPTAAEDAQVVKGQAVAEIAPPVEAAPVLAPDAAPEQSIEIAEAQEAPLIEVPAAARTVLAALPVARARTVIEPLPADTPDVPAAPVIAEAPIEIAPEAALADTSAEPEPEPERAITQVIAGLLRGALSADDATAEETIADEAPTEEVAAAEGALPANAALFADMAAERPKLIIATGTDSDGRISPSLLSMAHNTKIYPSESANRSDSLLSFDINSDRSVAEEAIAASPVAVARSYSASTITLTTRMANSPATLPVAGPLEPAVEASAAFAALGASAEPPLFLDGPSDAVAALAAPEEVGNAALRARLADAPTRAVHTIRLGDSLLTLALRYYGDPEKAEIILEANRRHLSEDGALLLGQIVRIPEIDNL
ncbi:MAG: hypothetical protein AAGF78_12250 [Pseudomonadota bacterium]